MAYNNPYAAYKQTGVKTATQGKLVVMLYNEAVKQLNSAINWFNSEGKVDPSHIEKLNTNILKAMLRKDHPVHTYLRLHLQQTPSPPERSHLFRHN